MLSGLYVTHRTTSIFAGIISPLVVLSSFPGLTETWRIIPLPNGEVERLPDPTILIVGQFFLLARCGLSLMMWDGGQDSHSLFRSL